MSAQGELFAEEELKPNFLWHAKIECDGGCSPNPGVGYGSYQITLESEPQPIVRLHFGDGQTNNTAEYLSLIKAVKALKELIEPKMTSLEIETDSSIVVYHVNHFRKAKRLKHTPLRLQLLKDELASLLGEFGEAKGGWRCRERSVEIFGH